ncbi:DUF1572 family protein [Empedobacter brevis]|uniref:DUF1572 family protein n=1 Tax=Empedobacter brevis TaxID=247 RepID=A0AAJ1V986_9FLAO|nr:DUF1572 family protein [Empedobacter brevis]MDM1074271.1 DUF1572 family protein [Empedobacter brevis]QES91401.1 DUF1572 domain-containing protein [Empedobacter brevis]QHC86450.1 hypothetical protein AS589_17520 [Empedobacter brevis]
MNDLMNGIIKQFQYYKQLGEKTFSQLSEQDLFWQYNENSNSIAIIVNHLSGNMLSRWTDFLTTDGEKEWRNRDEEFEAQIQSKDELLEKWQRGWNCMFDALKRIKKEEDLEQVIYIRNEGHTVIEAINRQLAHYPYHVGQIVFIGKLLKDAEWNSLSIPKNKSSDYNQNKFSSDRKKQHFTDEFLDKEK